MLASGASTHQAVEEHAIDRLLPERVFGNSAAALGARASWRYWGSLFPRGGRLSGSAGILPAGFRLVGWKPALAEPAHASPHRLAGGLRPCFADSPSRGE